MIRQLYETHLQVSDVRRSVLFFERLGLPLASINEAETVAFVWVGQPGRQMIGLWKVPEGQALQKRHVAFEVSLDDLRQAEGWLAERGIAPKAAFGLEPREPIVHRWMPAAALYFDDPDGNELELIAVLAAETEAERLAEPHTTLRPAPVLYLSQWEAGREAALAPVAR